MNTKFVKLPNDLFPTVPPHNFINPNCISIVRIFNLMDVPTPGDDRPFGKDDYYIELVTNMLLDNETIIIQSKYLNQQVLSKDDALNILFDLLN